ncbi:cell shape-determining protein MreC [Geobacter sp. OR-1]|uniref:rod shape-determining protein MreC n=1 Tax=Geobacter sp. OR-1 TaxID=1266765 RepID=UPI0005421723|nr:rod shape-determining protein MreC [Geobacter sp. OR-1]GAM08170.1 cell shape-determining protein MreC [Geobacter sp. OR-1]
MWELIKKYRKGFIIGLVLLAAFLVFASNLKNREDANIFERGLLTMFSPLFSLGAKVSAGAETLWNDYSALVNVRKQNRELLEQLRLMNGRLIGEQDALLENERLKKLLTLKGTVPIPAVAASIIGEDGAPWFKTMLIDRGGNDGFQEGMPVVASDGVVGQLIKVSGNSSRVLLITDHSSGIAAVVQRSRARGVVRGAGSGRLVLEFAIREEDVKVGDQVVTSGIGGIFPKGLPIGEVTMVKKGEYGIFQTIEVRPSVMISRLEEVLVLLKRRND